MHEITVFQKPPDAFGWIYRSGLGYLESRGVAHGLLMEIAADPGG
jgi:hypothetical protein